MNNIKSLMTWNVEHKGTNLLNYGVIVIFLNLFIFDFQVKNNDIGLLIHHLGFSIACLGGIGKALMSISVFKIKIWTFISIVSIVIAIFFFIANIFQFIEQLILILN